MPADGQLQIDLAYGQGKMLTMPLPADRTTVVAPAYYPAAPDVSATLQDALRIPVAGPPPLPEVVWSGQRAGVSVCDVAELAAAGPRARVCVLPQGPRTIPFVAAHRPMPASGVR